MRLAPSLAAVFLLAVSFIPSRAARKHGLPIGAEESPKKSRAAECQFGRQVRELGSTWFADLGPPFGVMYCIRCECVAVQKKRRVVGKVHCRNIKHECPKPSCDEPVLLPGKCCKVCPGDIENPDIALDMAPPTNQEDEKALRHFAALLTGRTTTVAVDSSLDNKNLVATGRFAFHRRNLYFSFYASSRPRTIQFLDHKGNILEEQTLTESSVYQNATGKVCGVWRRIPREYRRMIREERLIVSLTWEKPEMMVSGQLLRYRALATEMFSALLEGGQPGSGGTAIVSISTTAPSIHITIIFNGVFTPSQIAHVPIKIWLHSHDKQTVVIEEVVRVEKPSAELNVVQVRSAVSAADLRLLTRHRLTVTVASRSDSSLRLQGRVITKASCEIHQALVSPRDSTVPAPGAAAWAFVDKEGSIRYFARLHSLPHPAIVALVVERRLVELEDLTPSVSGSWANGTIERPVPRHLDQLYSGDLGINVATPESRSVARGRLVSRHVADSRDSGAPSLLLPTEHAPKTLIGMAWSAIDADCNLHYDVVMSGPGIDKGEFELYLSEVPIVAPGAPVSRRLLEPFSSTFLEGSMLSLVPGDLARIDAGMVHLEVEDLKLKTTILRAGWQKIPVPITCLPHYSNNDVDSQAMGRDPIEDSPPVACYHGGRFHSEGSQWDADHCLACHCSLGVTRCERIVCPNTCILAPPQPNQCCPSCPNMTMVQSNADVGCMMAGHFHRPGSSWHPYLPPNGFDTCTHCTCQTGKVSCRRLECPRLDCDDRTAIRPRKSCCKVCPPRQATSHHLLADQSMADSTAEILARGGCNYPVGGPYPNGHEWHPRLYSHGELKCVTCRCKDGSVKCERKRCNKWSCNDECCIAKCSRGRRHIRSRLS